MPLRRALQGSKMSWSVLQNHKFFARSTKMVRGNYENQLLVTQVLIFDKKSRCFVAEISAPWQHCISGHRVVLIGENRHRQEQKKSAKTPFYCTYIGYSTVYGQYITGS
jgi:hypothetical protein